MNGHPKDQGIWAQVMAIFPHCPPPQINSLTKLSIVHTYLPPFSLQDCIAGRKTVGEITGDITVNGHPKDQGTWARVMGYVEQMDIHTPAQTIIEALLFSARLRLPSETTDDQVGRRKGFWRAAGQGRERQWPSGGGRARHRFAMIQMHHHSCVICLAPPPSSSAL